MEGAGTGWRTSTPWRALTDRACPVLMGRAGGALSAPPRPPDCCCEVPACGTVGQRRPQGRHSPAVRTYLTRPGSSAPCKRCKRPPWPASPHLIRRMDSWEGTPLPASYFFPFSALTTRPSELALSTTCLDTHDAADPELLLTDSAVGVHHPSLLSPRRIR